MGATSRAARWIRADADFGEVAPGKAADLVLVQGDPTVDVEALSSIEQVWTRGKLVERLAPPSP
jgi:imidazolonepropionase-like amidohydrolase